MPEGTGQADRNTRHFTMYHKASTQPGRPRSSPRAGSNKSFRTRLTGSLGGMVVCVGATTDEAAACLSPQ